MKTLFPLNKLFLGLRDKNLPLATFVSLIPPRGFAAPTGDAKKGFALIKTSGRSMIEMLGVLAIIGVLSAGGIMGYSAAMENYKTNKTLDMIYSADANMQNLFVGKKQAVAVNIKIIADDLCKFNMLPVEICKTGTGEGRTGYFGEIVYPRYWIPKQASKGAPYFEMYMGKVPVSACVRLVTHLSWSAYPHAKAYQLGNANTFNPLPMKTDAAKTACEEQAAKASTFSLITNYKL